MYRTASSPFLFGCLLLALLLVPMLPSCTSSSQSQNADDDTFIGRPPPEDEDDPFFAHALPAEAIPADASGQIGVSAEDEVPVEEPTEAVDEPRPDPPDEAHPDPDPEQASACFSCVRICPIGDDGDPDCSDRPDDLICGWGSDRDLDSARNMARAQCDATLDMARHMPNYSSIGGECPQASCR